MSMFNRDSKPVRIDTLIARSVRVNGDVEFAGGLHLDGQVAGACGPIPQTRPPCQSAIPAP